jgi:hypothetical protein
VERQKRLVLSYVQLLFPQWGSTILAAEDLSNGRLEGRFFYAALSMSRATS